jgi:hypothetical protein
MAYRNQPITLPSPITTAGQATPIKGLGDATQIRAQLNAPNAPTGTTPSLTVLLEDSLDGTTWNTIGTFTAVTAINRQVINVTTPFSDQVRASWTVSGTTPSFTGVTLIVSGQ